MTWHRWRSDPRYGVSNGPLSDADADHDIHFFRDGDTFVEILADLPNLMIAQWMSDGEIWILWRA